MEISHLPPRTFKLLNSSFVLLHYIVILLFYIYIISTL